MFILESFAVETAFRLRVKRKFTQEIIKCDLRKISRILHIFAWLCRTTNKQGWRNHRDVGWWLRKNVIDARNHSSTHRLHTDNAMELANIWSIIDLATASAISRPDPRSVLLTDSPAICRSMIVARIAARIAPGEFSDRLYHYSRRHDYFRIVGNMVILQKMS